MNVLPQFVIDNGYRVYGLDPSNGVKACTSYLVPTLIAFKDGNVFSVYLYIGKQGGTYLEINNKRITYDNIYSSGSYGGYKVYKLKNFKLSAAIKKEEDYIKKCKKGIELGSSRLASLIAFRDKYPEYQI